MVSIKLSERALDDIKEIDQVLARRIIEKILWLEKNFDSIVPERLHRELRNSFKLRIGDYRVVYSVNGNLVTIEAVGHRRDIYR